MTIPISSTPIPSTRPLQMTALPETQSAAAVDGPCDSCIAAAHALRVLSVSLHNAQEALTHIRVPVPPDVALAMGYQSAAADVEIPQEVRDFCQRHGYMILAENKPALRPVDHAHTADPVAPSDSAAAANTPASWSCLDFTSRTHSLAAGHAQTDAISRAQTDAIGRAQTDAIGRAQTDAISISSGSTDWNEEFGITPPSSPIPAEAAVHQVVEDVPTSERWYAVTVGRNPGVYRGSHHIAANTHGVSGYSAQRYSSEEAAQKAYDEALEKGAVTQVNMTAATRSVLGISSA